jgi:phage gpG-like protein
MVIFQVNSKEFNAKVTEAIKQVSDLRPAMIQIAREFYKTNKAIFALKSAGKYADFTGPKIANTWKNPGLPEKRTRNGNYTSYQWAKEKATGLKKGYPLLKYTGALEKSITNSGDSNTINEITKSSVVLGTTIPYASFHQEGTKNIPMRQFLFVDPSTTVWAGDKQFSRRNEAWVKAIETYVMKTLGGTPNGND